MITKSFQLPRELQLDVLLKSNMLARKVKSVCEIGVPLATDFSLTTCNSEAVGV
jgi:hypothetical protein